MTARIAFFTFGAMKAPVGDPLVQGFVDRVANVYAASDGSAGFFARSVRNVETWEHSWGPMVLPRCAPVGLPLNQFAMTVSLWQDLESVAAFAYGAVHGEALTRRESWFTRGSWPAYVAWWVDGNHQPNWQEAADRLDMLQSNGSTPAAFNFRKPFDAAGLPQKLKRVAPSQ